MNGVALRLAGFVAALVAVFTAAFAVGTTTGPVDTTPEADGEAGQQMSEEHLTADAVAPTAQTETAHGGHDQAAPGPAGLAVSQEGYTLQPAVTAITAGTQQDFRFTISGPDGQPLRDYAVEHDRELHLILARRDLSGFQHVHPTRDAEGIWSVPLTVAEPGTYRVFADFTAAGGPSLTLGADLHVAGAFVPRALPAAAPTAEVDGYTVALEGDLIAGSESPLTLTVARDGAPVTDLEPYLGAYGHLVALREGDLAYLHVHPHGEPGDGSTPAGPAIAFTAGVPSVGTYRLYLDFQHQGVVRTAEFTATATAGGAAVEPVVPQAEAHDADGHTH
jgi:hypothetical protein